LGFLPHNFNPARIFMGDGGSPHARRPHGGVDDARGRTDQPRVLGQVFFFFAPLLIPFFVMGVPIIDTAFAIVRRARKRTGVAEADKDHLHHRLMRSGHGHRRSGGHLVALVDPAVAVRAVSRLHRQGRCRGARRRLRAWR
jgi:UDP-GlcNAc:undecaprenyl-phosphate/decaprenyl-phosphate GlcNAc-1-phosphate transferase